MKTILGIVKPFWWLFLIAISFLGLETFMDLMQPKLVSDLIDQGILGSNMAMVRHYGLLMLLATGAGMIGALTRNAISSHVSYLFAKNLRKKLFEHLLSLEYSQVNAMEDGGLVTRITSDVNVLMQFVNGLMRIFLKAPLLAIGSFVMVLSLDQRFLSVYLVILPIVLILTVIQIKIGFPLYGRIQKVLDRLNQRILEFLGGIRAVRAFDRFDYEQTQFEKINETYAQTSIDTERKMSLFGPAIMLVMNLAIVYVIFVGRDWVAEGTVGVGQIVAFSNYMIQFMFGMAVITRVFTIFVRAKTSALRIIEIFDQKPLEDYSGKKVSDYVADTSDLIGIEVEGLNFAYGMGEDVLKNMNFKIKPGEAIGIIGPTGCGKTTLVMNLLGLLKDHRGSIRYDKEEMRNLSHQKLSDVTGFVPQKTVLFTGSIKENLAYGKEGASDEHYWKALRDSGASEFVEKMEEGLETRIGRNGINISGGQKQRLSIARALVHEPKILVLDDSTSALDIITEKQVKAAIRAMKQITLLVVAQKVTSVMDLDRILVMEQGEITAFETHENLMVSSDFYQGLYKAQMGGDMDA